MNPHLNIQTPPNIPQTLSLQLRQSTMSAHKNAETGSFIRELFSGKCSSESYVLYLWALRQIYGALEKALSQTQNQPLIQQIYFPELFRTQSLDSDLDAFGFTTNVIVPENLKADVAKYVARIEYLSISNPALLVAHAYVRYLGDLSGGQMLAKALSRNLPKENAYSFYDFKDINPEEMKSLYRQRLDTIGNTNPEIQKDICIEANLVFDLNSQVFSAI